MSRLDEYFAKANRGSQTTSSVSASGEKPASNMDAYFAKAGKPVRTNPLNLYTEALKASQGQSTMQTPYADAAAQTKQSGTQNLYAQAAENAKKGRNAAKGTSAIFNSVYGKADDRESSVGSGKYADILKASDYAELSKSGESKRTIFGDARYDYINNIGNFRAQSDVQQAQGRGQDYGKYAFMTGDEIGVYNYLYATQGKKAANSYLSDLEPELDKQWYTGTNRATTEALGKNAATRTLASAMTVAAQPARTITSMIAMADDAVRTAKGQEINPYSKWRQASNITQDLRADTSQHIEETNPGMGGKVGSFVYNTAMSAADSAMNALVAKGVGEAVGLTGDTLMKATNILGSALMSSEAASLSIAESKEKGYSNAGALALGLTRGAIEYASEAVGGEWVIRKIKANPLSFVKSMALTMIPEGMEEVMSDAANGVVNLAIDAAFGTEESGIPKMLEYYRTSGTDWQKKHAELATVLAVLGQEGLSFLGGALATLGSSSVQYGTNRANINQTAERLDTTPKNVVQMMQDAQTENPGVIYALAELTDAENADGLRQKIGTKEDMKRAAEYLTQQMEADGRFGAQEGTYTAGVQNAPVGAQRAQNEGISTTPAAAINIQEGMNNGQSTYHREESGAAYVGSRGQAAEGAEGGLQALAGGRTEVQRGVGTDAQADLRQVTPAQLGIRNGGTEAVTVVDAQRLGGEAKSAYDAVLENGLEPVAVRGAIQVGDGYANAYTESGRVFFRVDAVDSRGNAISPEMLAQHEMFHNYASEEVIRATDEVIRESMTAEEYDAMRDAYKADYAGVYDFANMSVDEIERLLTEEIAADAYAGLNWFSGDAPVQEAVRAETERNAPARRAEARQQWTGPPEGRAQAFVGYDAETGRGIYRSNFEENTPKAKKSERVIRLIQDVWSKNPIDLVVENEDGSKSIIKAEFDPRFDEGENTRSDAAKLAAGNRHGTAAEKRVTLNLADDFYRIIQESTYGGSKAETGKTSATHAGVNMWRYFVNPILYMERSGNETTPYTVSIDVKQKDNGNFVYSFHAERDAKNNGQPAPQTLHAAVNGAENDTANGLPKKGGIAGIANASALTKTSETSAGTAPFESTIRQTEGNSQEKSSGRASVEVENRNTAMSEEDARRERLRKLQEADRKELDRLTKRDDTLHQINRENGRPMPNKGSGEVYRELMSKGKSEVLTPISMDNPRTLSFKITMDTNVLGVATATIMHNGHQIYKETGPIKEYVARDAAEFVDVQANKNFSEENFERARQLEAEKTSDEDARIAELFGDSEEAAKQELTDKTVKNLTEKGQADKAEEYAARATIAGTTEKVIPEVLKAERNYREEIEKITSGAMRMFVNAGDTVRRIAKATKSKSLEGYYFNAGAYSQRAGNWIAKGGARTDIDGHKIGASLADTLAPMRKDAAKYRDFQLYLLHMHNIDRMKYDNSAELQRIKDELIRVKERYPQLKELSAQELARVASDAADDPITRAEAHEMYIEAHQGKDPRIGTVNMAAAYVQELQKQRAIAEKQGLKPVFGYDVTADDSQTAAMLLEAKNPEFKEWAKEVYKYSDDLIRYRVEAGLITREFADALKKRYPHYIPTLREEGTNSKKARSARRNGGIVVSNAIGRAVGSDGVLLPLHTALSRKTVSTMRNAGLNQFGLALVREYEGNKKAAEKYIWNVAESEYTPTEAALESDEDYKPVFENIFSVKENGKAYDITMDEGLTAAMKAFEPDKFANYGAAKAMKKLNDLFKALCTGYNPFFMIRNGVRDWQDAGFYSTDWKTWEKMYWSAWNQIAKNGEIWQQYKALGGSYASMLDYTTGMVKEPKNALGKAAARYERLGQAIEAAPRLAEFMTILANKGGSKTVDGVKTGQFTQSDLMEAMLGAADITTNFARGGSVTKALNRYLVPFLNPSIQGFDKFIRNATETRSVKAAGSLILKAALMGIAPALLNALAYRDDDEWDDIPANTKANYYLINFGNGIWLKIPKGRAIAVLSTAAVYGKEKLDGEDVKFSDVFEVIKSNIAPTDIFNQNIATAWTQTKLTNPDNPGTTWYGGNIESDRLQNYRPSERYDEKTDELSKWLGKTFNLSPKKINYLLDQYSGVIGDILLPLMTPATSAKSKLLAAPMTAFTIDTTSTNKTTGEYYDLLDELKYDANDGDIGAGITRKYVSHAGDEVNDYYQQIRAIQNDKSLSDGEKNRLVRALKKQLIERQKEIIAQAEPYREAVSDYLKAHPELSTDNDAAIAEYAERYEITEDQAESRMDAIVYREANREVFGAEYALRTYNADVYDKARAAYAKGVSYDTYYDYYFATKEMHADKDENGKSISGSKKAKVVEYINSLDIPPEQKDALYVAAGYTEKSARNQKWNGGSGGSGGRRGRGKRTALKAPTPKAPEIIIPKSGTASSAKAGGTSKTPKVSGNVIADFTKTASGTDIQKAVTQAKRKALKAGNRTVYVEEGSPIDYFLKYGKLPSLK